VEIRPISPVGGAEVVGLDMRRPLAPDAVQELEQAFSQHGVLLFRKQPLTPKELTAFARHFGELQPHVQRRYQHPEAPEVVIMTNRKPDGTFDEAGARRGAIERTRDGWHSDLSYDPVPAKATLLHAVEIPSRGGNTCFANSAMAYRDLPAELKARLAGLEAEFVYGGHSRNAKTAIAASALDAQAQATARAVHPAVVVHPVTGKPAVYINPVITTRILGLPEAEGEALMEAVFDRLDRPEYRWEHQWSVGDTLMWDNLGGTLHTGRLDYPRDEARRFIRTTLRGQPVMMHDPLSSSEPVNDWQVGDGEG
jgi:taurine dioxygenase